VARYSLHYHPKVVEVDIPRLDPPTRKRVKAAIEAKLLLQPEQSAKPLAYNKAGLWSLRVGNWRVVFALRAEELWILRIGHRSEVYEEGSRSIPSLP
jgi:mRNA interferase RelE/StbE